MNEDSNPIVAADDDFLGANIVVEERGFGPAYPTIQWVNGQKQLKNIGGIAYTGGFFCSADQGIAPEELEAAGFEKYTLMAQDGTEIHGYSVQELTGAPLRFRRCFTVDRGESQLPARYSNEEYDQAVIEGKPRGVCHVLFQVKGISQPVSLSFRGLTARVVMGMGRDRGIIPTFGQKVVKAASMLAKAQNRPSNFPLCAFKLTIGPETDSAGNPVFTDVGSDKKSSVTNPVWLDEPSGAVTAEELRGLFVGHAQLAVNQDSWVEAGPWVTAWSTEELSAQRNRASSRNGGTPAEETGETETVGADKMSF